MKAATMHRWSLASRIAAGTAGAYALTALLTAALCVLAVRLGADPVEAATGVTIASFAVFTAITMSVFHARSVRKAWAWLALVAVPCPLFVLLLGARA